MIVADTFTGIFLQFWMIGIACVMMTYTIAQLSFKLGVYLKYRYDRWKYRAVLREE